MHGFLPNCPHQHHGCVVWQDLLTWSCFLFLGSLRTPNEIFAFSLLQSLFSLHNSTFKIDVFTWKHERKDKHTVTGHKPSVMHIFLYCLGEGKPNQCTVQKNQNSWFLYHGKLYLHIFICTSIILQRPYLMRYTRILQKGILPEANTWTKLQLI